MRSDTKHKAKCGAQSLYYCRRNCGVRKHCLILNPDLRAKAETEGYIDAIKRSNPGSKQRAMSTQERERAFLISLEKWAIAVAFETDTKDEELKKTDALMFDLLKDYVAAHQPDQEVKGDPSRESDKC